MNFDSVYGTTAVSWRVKTLLEMKAVCTNLVLFKRHVKGATEKLNILFANQYEHSGHCLTQHRFARWKTISNQNHPRPP